MPSLHAHSQCGAGVTAEDDGESPRADRRPLRVVMVTPRYLPEIGGVERHVHEVATRLVDGGDAEVTVVTTVNTGTFSSLRFGRRRGGAPRPGAPERTGLRLAPGIWPLVTSGAWDLVHVQSYHTLVAPIAMAAAARRGVPFVVTFHGGGHSGRVRNHVRVAQRRALRPLLARAAALVAVAQFEIDEYGRELGVPASRFALIPNGVDLPSEPSPAPVATPDDSAASDRVGGTPRALQGPSSGDRGAPARAASRFRAHDCGSRAPARTRGSFAAWSESSGSTTLSRSPRFLPMIEGRWRDDSPGRASSSS